jgi:hypothetical protein
MFKQVENPYRTDGTLSEDLQYDAFDAGAKAQMVEDARVLLSKRVIMSVDKQLHPTKKVLFALTPEEHESLKKLAGE